jgi:hypothetical protein
MCGVQGFKEDSANVFLSLKEYFYKTFLDSKKTKEDIYKIFREDGRYKSEASVKVNSSYKIGWGDGDRWDLPDKKIFNELKKILPFKKEYDELKKEHDELQKEYYSTRAYFNNTHDNFNNVWKFDRTSNQERETAG